MDLTDEFSGNDSELISLTRRQVFSIVSLTTVTALASCASTGSTQVRVRAATADPHKNVSNIQAAIDHCATQGGGTVLFPSGTYHCDRPLKARSNVTLSLTSTTKILKDANDGRPLITNASARVKVNQFRIIGPGRLGATDLWRQGQIIALYGDDIELTGFSITTYAGGQACLIGGNRVRITRLHISNAHPGPGAGGIRMFGGSDFVASDCVVESGDDALQFTPIASAGHPWRNITIRNSKYVRCSGSASSGRFLVAVLSTSPPGRGGMSCSISGAEFIDCQGTAARRAIVIQNTDSSGTLEDVTLLRCTVNCAGSSGPSQEVLVWRKGRSGPVRRITFDGLRISRPQWTAVAALGDARAGSFIEDLAIRNSVLDAPGNGDSTIKVDAVNGLSLTDSTINGTMRANVIEGQVGSRAARLVVLDGVRVSGIGDAFSGAHLPAASVPKVTRSTFTSVLGLPAHNGVTTFN